jgi:hypothetical protein
VERFAELSPPVEMGLDAPVHPLETIRQRVRALAEDARTDAVDEVWKLLLAARSEDGLPALIHELLEHSHVERVRDSHGNTLRFVLIDTLLDLGFPHALEVSPDELAYHRERGPDASPRGRVLAAFALASGLGSTAWAGLWTIMLLAISEHEGARLWWVFIPLLLAIEHGISAVIQSARALGAPPEREKAVPTLTRLGWEGFVGLFAIIVASVATNDAIGMAMLVASLPIFTAVLCALTVWRMKQKD